MHKFMQLHLLTSYPPSNLNRDDLGRPKTAEMGGVKRLRISSQSLKRAWRKSRVFDEAAKGHVGTRTKEMGARVAKRLIDGGIAEKKAREWEDDFFTAVDDLNKGIEDVGAGHMGETEFGAGLFYLYICVDRASLLENLGGDEDLARRTLAALVEAAVKVSPTGKQNSFASRAYASFALCETGDQQPRSLSVAFLKPVTGKDLLSNGVERLRETREKMDRVYGACAERVCQFSVLTGEGSLAEVIECATG